MKHLSSILIRPRVTEKASFSADNSVYVFEIERSASKKDVTMAVKDLYKVTPVKVSTVTTPAKRVVVRGKRGAQASVKKAYIYLKKGEKIEIV